MKNKNKEKSQIRVIYLPLQRKQNEECVPDGLATIDPQNNIQAAGVPCQAFIGYFINDISKNESIRKEGALLKSIDKFCPQYDKFFLMFYLLILKSYQANYLLKVYLKSYF